MVGFYRVGVIDQILVYSPADYVRRPPMPTDSPTLGLGHLQFEALLTAARLSATVTTSPWSRCWGCSGCGSSKPLPQTGTAPESDGSAAPSRSSGTQGSGLGSVLTTAMLTGEIFKTVTALRPEAHRHIQALDFCPVSLFEPHEVDPEHLHVEQLALIGAGAIGTAVALILKELKASGELTVVDRQIFEPPNVITYSLGTSQDAADRLPKVDVVRAALRQMDVRHIHGTIEDYITQIDAGRAAMPHTVLGAVDNIAARHDLQRIYADLVLDGGTGGRAGTTVSLHEAPSAWPMHALLLPDRRHNTDRRAEAPPRHRFAAHTNRSRGPAPYRGRPSRTPTPRPSTPRTTGRPVCGLSRIMGLTTLSGTDNYQPSAAFVAQQAASLIVGALIARTQPGASHMPIRQIEYDTLYGPRPDMVDDRRPRPDCYCQANADVIRLVRHQRAS